MLAFDLWNVLWVALGVLGVLFLLYLVQVIHLSTVMAWTEQETQGLAYYGAPPAERAAFKAKLRRHAVMLYPVLRWMSRRDNFTFDQASFSVDGVAGPKGTCSAESFSAAMRYQPAAHDVFVVTQMKCGTTWMQHVVYEVLLRGRGDLVERGATLYSVSPWVEANKSVPITAAPKIGSERPSVVIKTHLPRSACPYSPAAKYVYVVRHPVSCFASCVDFIRTNIGAFAPRLDVVEDWFRSEDKMWWGTWPTHVEGWWQAAAENDNVLFVSFESMKADLGAVVDSVAEFLQMAPLDPEERSAVVEKCGFAYMKEHGEAFEMHPPHVLQTDAELFVSGKADRHKDVPDEVRSRVLQWCRGRVDGMAFPAGEYYPDLVS